MIISNSPLMLQHFKTNNHTYTDTHSPLSSLSLTTTPFKVSGMISAGGVSHQLQAIQDEKFLARMLSKENSAANPSFRVYYGVSSGEVPFFWESRPGTPKHAMAATTLPPLTPPPSYYTSSKNTKPRPKSPKHNLIHAILPRLRRKRHLPSPPTPSTDSSSISSCSHRRGRSYSATSSFSSSSRADDGEISPTSALCFGDRLAAMAGFKKALLAVVGNRSGR